MVQLTEWHRLQTGMPKNVSLFSELYTTSASLSQTQHAVTGTWIHGYMLFVSGGVSRANKGIRVIMMRGPLHANAMPLLITTDHSRRAQRLPATRLHDFPKRVHQKVVMHSKLEEF